MEQEQQRLYPAGIQTFSDIRSENYVYVDKTEYVYRMTHSGPRYLFLSRPRRFGKSLLTSTLHAYFEGRRDLFKGLAIERLEEEWTEYPVLHFDMSKAKYQDEEELKQELSLKLSRYEEVYGRKEEEKKLNNRLEGLIMRMAEQTGKKVVILIDEYDAPLLDVVHEEETLPELRQVMRNFYSPLKGSDQYLRFVFITGITKFSQLSIFSELNNLSNISMLPQYGAICGITREELSGQMAEDIEILGTKLGKTTEATLAALTNYYDGYHFTWPSPDVFNPYSLMRAFNDGQIDAYWFESGTPTYLIEIMRKYGVEPSMIGRREAVAGDFNAPVKTMASTTPLFYQSGYLTIKDCDNDEAEKSYWLDIPNKEIRTGLMRSLMPYYMALPPEEGNNTVKNMYRAIKKGDMEGALLTMQAYLRSIPYTANTAYEGHYQQVVYIIFTLLGIYMDVEVHTQKGRVDMVMRAWGKLYLVELMLNKSAEAAMRQIDLKDYASRFSLCGLPIVKVGVNFDTEERTISDWKIEK